MLTKADLETLEARWRDRGLPIADHMAPGLTDAALDAVASEFSLGLPEELRTWWGWHDGLVGTRDTQNDARVWERYPGGSVLLTSSEAITVARNHRALSEELEEPGEWEADDWWKTSWVPFVETLEGAAMLCETAKATKNGCPVAYHHWGTTTDSLDGPHPLASSLGELVRWWIGLYDCGAFYEDTRTGRWHFREVEGRPGPKLDWFI